MNRLLSKPIFLSSLLLALGGAPSALLATPSSTSPYVTDPQNLHVQDATSEGVAQLNMVLCIMNAMSPSDMVNAGPYIALVDKNKCDTSGRDSASNSADTSGAGAAPDYMNAIVDVTRASNSDPMIGKVWMSMTEQGQSVSIFVRITATASPTASLPYGVFRLDYLGKSGGSTLFNGFVDSGTGGISYYEDSFGGGPTETRALTLSASSTTSGAGSMSDSVAGATFNFAYNPAYFRRSDGTRDMCFDRAQTNTDRSVWRYGTYNATDGSRVDLAHPGFPVRASYGGNSYFGFASYWGINFQGLNLNGMADASPIAGLTATDQRPGNSTSYSVSKVSGKLTKFTRASAVLSAIDGFPIQAWGNFYAITGNNPLLNGIVQVEMHWDNTAHQFVITGKQSCSASGCITVPLTGNATVAFTSAAQDINGFSQSVGGQVTIPAGAFGSGSPVNYFTQSTVIPGSAGAPTNLQCLNNCVTAVALAAFNGSNSPFDANTTTQWGSGSNRVVYTFGATGLVNGATALVAYGMNAGNFTGNFQGGIRTGKLFPALDTNGTNGCAANYCEPNTDFYTWELGPNPWNQSLWLATGGSAVVIDPPQNISYTVQAADDPGNTWVGKTIQLQFGGFGNLWGIPGHCVDPVDNSAVACGPNVRFVPEFALADGATMTLNGTPLVVKALDAELRLRNVAMIQCTGQSLTLPSPALTLPTSAGLHDPSNAVDAYYIGSAPSVSGAPKVIHGVVQ